MRDKHRFKFTTTISTIQGWQIETVVQCRCTKCGAYAKRTTNLRRKVPNAKRTLKLQIKEKSCFETRVQEVVED